MAQQQNPQQNPAAETEQDINILKKIRMEKLAERQAAGNDPFTITKYDVTAHAADLKASYEATEARLLAEANGDEETFQASLEPLKEQIVAIAGRVMSWRDMGRANFIDVRDSTDRIQVYVRMNDIGGKEAFKEFKKWDIGDIGRVSRALCSGRRKAKFRFMPRKSSYSPSPCCPCQKSGTG